MRRVFFSLIVVLVGLAMVGGGGWGVYSDVTDDDDDSSSSSGSSDSMPKTSSPEDCSQVAERDPRFKSPHDLTFGAGGKATVQCNGSTVNFTIDIDGLEEGEFYEVVLERGGREEKIGSFLSTSVSSVGTA